MKHNINKPPKGSRQINDYPDYYVTRYGFVWSANLNGYLSPFKNKRGYLQLSIFNEHGRKYMTVHRLVMEAFGSPAKKHQKQTNHKNGNKMDNRIENLEWCDGPHNIEHALKLGLFPKGERCKASLLTNKQVKWIRKVYKLGINPAYPGNTMKIANKLGVSRNTILYIIKNETWKHL